MYFRWWTRFFDIRSLHVPDCNIVGVVLRLILRFVRGKETRGPTGEYATFQKRDDTIEKMLPLLRPPLAPRVMQTDTTSKSPQSVFSSSKPCTVVGSCYLRFPFENRPINRPANYATRLNFRGLTKRRYLWLTLRKKEEKKRKKKWKKR